MSIEVESSNLPSRGISQEYANSTTRVADAGSTGPVRTNSIDSLRGWAIFGMALSGMIPFGILPSWMYHAQLPPPSHVFNPKIFGITWVDLVFPFFIFSMGAAMPLALSKFGNDSNSAIRVTGKLIGRFFMLAFFAYWIEITRYSQLAKNPDGWLHVVLPAFAVLFLIYVKPPKSLPNWLLWVTIPVGFVLAWLIVEPVIRPTLNSPTAVFKCDIILAVLANVAIVGGLIVYFTRSQPWFRWIFIVGSAVLFFNKSFPTFLHEALSVAPRFKMIHQPEFLKYLTIVLIGSLLGDLVMRWPVKVVQNLQPENQEVKHLRQLQFLVIGLGIVLVGIVTSLLYFQKPIDALIVAMVFCAAIVGCVWNWPPELSKLTRPWALISWLVLVVGLILAVDFTPIQKDPTSLSYFFVTSGLAGFFLLSLQIWDQLSKRKVPGIFALVGQNALLGYAVITHLAPVIWKKGGIENALLDLTLKHPALGFARGLLETILVMIIVALLTKFKLHLRA